MKELDKLKKHWKSSEESYPRFSEQEIYAMLHKTSSSVVKWIVIVSILEFALWTFISFLIKDSQTSKRIDSMNIEYITIPMTVIGYGIILYFFVLFCLNYKKITVTDNARTLMQNILKTRKAVSNYIIVNLAYIFISSIIIFIALFKHDAKLIDAVHRYEANGNATAFYLIYFGTAVALLAVFIFFLWLFYKLIYGLLLKRLHRNYQELKKIDF
ncbi:hypothetical protein [Flavobacterium sp. MK4S-17]|uniref:hypothetical protein n=1 Tax=Flavobacterium sp. MK4S-17 TaxID=2543737 RepID=UPI001358C106|nr:hypothetical protein [Flavobacterium sp. MK4S-17]